MVDYKKTKIYSVKCRTDDTVIYFGFTTVDIDKCWKRIIKVFKSGYNTSYYNLIKNIDDWYIQFELNYPCNSYSEANVGKQIFINKYHSLNYECNDDNIKSLYRYNGLKL